MAADVYADTVDYTVVWDEDLGAARLTWNRDVSGDVYRHGMQALFGLIRERAASEAFVDRREVVSVDEADREWLVETWAPLAIEAGLESIAVVYSDSASVESDRDRAVDVLVDTPLGFHASTELDGARSWLDRQ